MKKNLIIDLRELLSAQGDKVEKNSGDERLTNILINVCYLAFIECTDLISIDASCGNNLNLNLHYRNGSSTLMQISEDDSKKIH